MVFVLDRLLICGYKQVLVVVNHKVTTSLVPRPHPQKEERVWYTSSAFWGLLTWHFCFPMHQSHSRHVAYTWLSHDTALQPTIATYMYESSWCVTMPKRCIAMTTHQIMIFTMCSIHCPLKIFIICLLFSEIMQECPGDEARHFTCSSCQQYYNHYSMSSA
jgi:hypothetical protein